MVIFRIVTKVTDRRSTLETDIKRSAGMSKSGRMRTYWISVGNIGGFVGEYQSSLEAETIMSEPYEPTKWIPIPLPPEKGT